MFAGALVSGGGAPGAAPDPDPELDSWIRTLSRMEDSVATESIDDTSPLRILGPDPFLIAAAPLSAGNDWIVLLRGSDEIAILDDRFQITSRYPAPADPYSWAWVDSTTLLVGGQSDGSIALYGFAPGVEREGHNGRAAPFHELARIDLPTHTVRGVTFDPASRIGVALDPLGDRALGFSVGPAGDLLVRRAEFDLPLPAGPLQAIFLDDLLITNSLLDHTISIHRRDTTPAPEGDGTTTGERSRGQMAPTSSESVHRELVERASALIEALEPGVRWNLLASVVHDGPIWSIDAFAHGDTIWIAAGGVENHPLDRTRGEFGNVDSYLTLYRFVRAGSTGVAADAGYAAPVTRLVPDVGLEDAGTRNSSTYDIQSALNAKYGSFSDKYAFHCVRDRTNSASPRTPGAGVPSDPGADRITETPRDLVRIAEWNLSEFDVVTPKRVRFDEAAGAIWVSGFGSERLLRIPFDPAGVDPLSLPTGASDRSVISIACPPGISDFVIDHEKRQLVATSPLLDAIIAIPMSADDPHGRAPYKVTTLSMPEAVVSGPAADESAALASAAAVPEPAASPSALSGLPEIDARTVAELRLGELLTFTTLLAPVNQSDGSLSRFTCEACHFEGGVDGRTHFTGRGHVFATTKPIRGLGHNVPLFSRAGATSLAEMVPAEFHVANQGRADQHWITSTDHPWLLSSTDHPWLLSIASPVTFHDDLRQAPKTIAPDLLRQSSSVMSSDVLPRDSASESEMPDPNSIAISPEEQRRSLLRYLFELPVIPHPGRSSAWTALEQGGLRVFRERCASCHLPIRTTRDEGSRVPFEEWAAYLSDPNSDLIWGAPFLIKTGIEPYVSPAGARVPSLRRVRWKRPYFTNGSARSLEEVLERFRYDRVMGWHQPPEGNASHGAVQSLTSAEQTALRALLDRF